MSELIKELDKQISIDKEIVEVSPKSGVKQIRSLKKKLEEMLARYNSINESALFEMNTRYDRINSIQSNPEIKTVNDYIYKLDNLVIRENGKTSFERMQLDKTTYELNGYYKKNLDVVNKDIVTCIKKFEEVGIKLTAKDFNISEYATEYMTVLLEETEKGDFNSERVKDTFEKVYWQSSDLMIHILVNIRKIYNIYEATIDKYYENKAKEVLTTLKVSEKQIFDKKDELIKKLIALKSVDGRIILDSFIKGMYSIGDYRTDNYTNIYENILAKKIADMTPEDKMSADENFKKLNNNLDEYINYMEFKFISDEILNMKREIEKEHDENKDKKGNPISKTELIKKDIKKALDEIKKLNEEINHTPTKRIRFFNFFKKKALPRNTIELISDRNNKILELKELYINLDASRLNDKISENITDTSKILDLFKIASYDYGFLARTIIKKHNDIVPEDITRMIEKFIKFVRLYNFSVLNNVNAYEKKDLTVVIKDKHKLLGIEISKETFSEANFDEFAKQIQIIDYYNDIEKSNILFEDIQYIMNARSVLKR